MAVQATELMDELHIDQSPVEIVSVISLITEAQAVVDQAIGGDTTEGYRSSPIYDLTVKTLATALYFDRDLTDGFPKGLVMMLDYLEYQRLGDEFGTK